jgi:hypothetical protein
MDYSATITTTAPPEAAARKIGDELERWWSTRVTRSDSAFTLRFNNSHASFALDPGATADAFSWTCTDAHMIIEDVADAGEWRGTQLVWQVTPTETGSAVTMTHKGLTPDIACFDVCRRGWQHYFETSLRDHLNGADGAPNIT